MQIEMINPFTNEVTDTPFTSGFTYPTAMIFFNGDSDPQQHLNISLSKKKSEHVLNKNGSKRSIWEALCKIYTSHHLRWSHHSVVPQAFMNHFSVSRLFKGTKSFNLFNLCQRVDKPLKDFINSFSKEAMQAMIQNPRST